MELVKAKGGKVTREPGPVKGGNTVIAFVEDPDGYKFELLERGPTPEPLCQVMLRVGDLDRSIAFYEKVRAVLGKMSFCLLYLLSLLLICFGSDLLADNPFPFCYPGFWHGASSQER